MVQFNTKDNEILVKIVYYGPGLSGKTTNLQKLHEMTDPTQKTDLFSVNTMQDRTLFFDLLPLDLGYVYGNSIKLQIYTVPGQVHYDSTRRIVLSGADGVVFVADSDQAKLQENIQSINNLYHNLQANRLNIKEIPLVMQYNKRDLANITSLEVMEQKLNFRNVPHFEAIGIKGEGVLETFLETVKQTVRYIFNKYQLSKNIKNVDNVIEKLETSIRNKAVNPVSQPKPQKAGAGKTVLKYTHSVEESKSDKDELLQKAITSNMETAQLYTSLKKSKAALQKKQEELQSLYKQIEKSNNDNLKMRRFLESLVNFAGEAIITFDEMWVIQNWNQAAEELFGYQRKAVLNKNINILFPQESMDDLNRVLTYVMNGKVVRGFETTLKSRQGEALPVNITFSPIKNQNESIVAFTGIVRDLSFVSKISKQFHLVQRYEATSVLLPELVDRVLKSAKLDASLTRGLETVRKLAEEPIKVTEPVNINHVVENIYLLIEPRLKLRKIGWQAQLFPRMPEVLANRTEITRALMNLTLNALDAVEGREGARLTVGSHYNNSEIIVQLIDNGQGMASEELDRMYESMLDQQRSLTGIRINASKEIIQGFGGMFRIDSAPGRGTKVTIRLPAG
ncbi:MAG: PAS domain S-box protein [Acidobacteriota bacterium]|nr:PAS domain S-box protein [Acidobacteriota bacterium]